MQGLDDIPWSTLHYAYGTAEDVPELLRRLLFASDHDYDAAWLIDSPFTHLCDTVRYVVRRLTGRT